MRDTEFENIEGPKTQIKSKEDQGIDQEIDAIISSNETADALLNSYEQEGDEESSETASEVEITNDRSQPQVADIDLDFGKVKKALKRIIPPTLTWMKKVGSKIAESIKSATEEARTSSHLTLSDLEAEEEENIPEPDQNEQGNQEVSLQTGQPLERAPIRLGPLSKFSVKCSILPNIPPKSEKFIPDGEIKLDTRSIKTLIILIAGLSLFQKGLTLLDLIGCVPSPLGRLYTLGILTLVVGPIALTLLKNCFTKSKIVAFLLWGQMVSMTASFYAIGLNQGFPWLFVPAFIGGVAGDLSLLHHSLTKKALRPKALFKTTLFIYVVLYFVATCCHAFGYWGFMHWLLPLIFGGVFFGVCSAKEVLVLDERLKQVDKPIGLGECGYYAIMGRYDASIRQIVLIYSKISSE